VAEGTQWWPVWRWLRWFIAGGGTVSIGLALLVSYLLGVGHVWGLAGSISSLMFGSMHLASGVAEYRRQHAHAVSHTPGPPGLPPFSSRP
jgi:hypothetical protein